MFLWFFSPDLQPPQVGQMTTCDSRKSVFRRLAAVDLRPPQIGKMKNIENSPKDWS